MIGNWRRRSLGWWRGVVRLVSDYWFAVACATAARVLLVSRRCARECAAAGCVAASRLVADGGRRVLLLEGGYSHRHPLLDQRGIFRQSRRLALSRDEFHPNRRRGGQRHGQSE